MMLMDRYILTARCLTDEQEAAFKVKFYGLNPHYKGAPVEDCLAPLDDGDAHLDVTEPMYEQLGDLEANLRKLLTPCVHACLYATDADPKTVEFRHHVANLMQRCTSVLEREGTDVY